MEELKFGTSGLRDTVENMIDMECYVNARGFIAYLEGSGEFKKGDTMALGGDRRPSTYKIKRAVEYAISIGLEVNAGHGLDYANVKDIAWIKGINELNIGHSIVARAVIVGMRRAVEEMIGLIR